MRKSFQLAALFAIILLGSCTGGNNNSATQKAEEKSRVKLASVTARPVEQIQEYTATVEAEIKNNIAPATPVRIDKIFVEVGDQVKKGQKLVQMDAASLKQLKLQIENQKIEFRRVDELYKVGGASKAEWDTAKMSLEVNETAYKNLMENTSLVSPISGVITARNYDNGDMYTSANPVLTVEQITPVKLMINVSETYFTKVKKGAPVTIKIDVYGDQEFQGVISLVYPTIDPQTRTFPVEIKLPNKDQKVRPGMFARATLNFGTQDNVVVPDLAIVKQPGSGDRYVYVYKDGKVYHNKVELGRRMGAEYELKSGVDNNAQVVVAGQVRLVDGMEVEIEKYIPLASGPGLMYNSFWKWCPPAKPTPFPPPVLLCHQQGGHSFCFADPRLHPLMGRISALWKGGGVNRNSSNLSRSNRYFFPHLVEGISPAITFLLIAVLVSAVPGSCSRT